MVFLACGEDPNFGPYSNHVRRSLRSIIEAQDSATGIMGMSMYHHGFATLALAEAYGVVDERNLWPDGKGPRSIGQALELAVRGARHVPEEKPARRLAVFSRRPRRRHVSERSGLRRAAWQPATPASRSPMRPSTRRSVLCPDDVGLG